jgi:8-oxo-dGTP pyrophosphatase MutT (NUDIX family)
VIADSGEQVLVLRRKERLGPDGRTEIRLPKGHIEPGEDPEQTALREVHEEAGLTPLATIADLGNQVVEFDWKGYHYIRNEFYYLLMPLASTDFKDPEEQFERLWLDWDHALEQLTFEAEREWVRRAQRAWYGRLEDVSQQYPEEANNHSQMEQQVPFGKQEE